MNLLFPLCLRQCIRLSRASAMASLCIALGLVTACSSRQELVFSKERDRLQGLSHELLATQVDEFNSYEGRPKSDGPYNAHNNKAFLISNIPLFLSSDDATNKVYNYRWWMVSKHLKEYADPEDQQKYWVVTEFFGPRPWASLSGAITCPAGHQFYDVRWLRDDKYLKSYADYFIRGSASHLNQRENGNFLTYLSRPESHHFSSWMLDGVDAYLRIHPDSAWLHGILPDMERHQAVWDSLFTVQRSGAKTDGLYKILDLYDGMEFSLSAVLGLIASEGAYDLYTADNWRDYYLGWGTTDNAAKSAQAAQYPRAYRKGYPDLYLVRPSVNGYAYGNLRALSELYRMDERDYAQSGASKKSALYQQRATRLQNKVMDVLWNDEDHFFNSYTAGDNAFGAHDFEARVRESVGYTPWYFNMIPADKATDYADAWSLFASDKGFNNKQGMTTAERQHPYYNEQTYAWNGRGWPFQNSVVYKAYANYLRHYKQDISDADRRILYDHIRKLTALHNPAQPNIGEWYIPSDGKTFGGEQDYFHSTFPDIIIEDLLGFKAQHDDKFEVQPLLPEAEWDFFYLGRLRYHEHDVDIVWKKDWDADKPGDQNMLCVWVDGKLAARSERLNTKLTVSLSK
ncbi:MGH1-like glycoside hydrolase domain-containing protein [Sphingobacterium bambusae]